jgi:hypothetical protein
MIFIPQKAPCRDRMIGTFIVPNGVTSMRTISELGFAVPDILIPQKGTDLEKWAVIACDQYTSEPDYWKNAENEAGNAPSALNLVLPEVYLGKDEEAKKLESIAKTATEYLNNGVLESLGTGFILTDRSTSLHPSRKGLMAAIDLEGYSFEPGNKNICRATEGTVLSRIPPRIRIRASMAFLGSTMPPKSLPESVKFAGMAYTLLNSCSSI